MLCVGFNLHGLFRGFVQVLARIASKMRLGPAVSGPTSETINPTPYTLKHLEPAVSGPTPETINPTPYTLKHLEPAVSGPTPGIML